MPKIEVYRFLEKSPAHFRFTRFLTGLCAVGIFFAIPVMSSHSKNGQEEREVEPLELSMLAAVESPEEVETVDSSLDPVFVQHISLDHDFEFNYPIAFQELSEKQRYLPFDCVAAVVDPATEIEDLSDPGVAFLAVLNASDHTVEFSELGVRRWLERTGFRDVSVIREPTGRDFHAIAVTAKREIGGEALVSRQWWLKRDDQLLVLFGETVSHEASRYGPIFSKSYQDFHFL